MLSQTSNQLVVSPFAQKVVRRSPFALSMKTMSQSLARLVLADLPEPFEEWWQPVPGTDPDAQLRLHRLRMSFACAALRLHGQTDHGLRSAGWLAATQPVSALQTRESRAQCHLRALRPTPLVLPEEPAACAAVRAEIFPHLPSDLSRYLYLTLLHDVETPRFNYPSLQDRYSAYKLHAAIVSLATRLAWRLCLVQERDLQHSIRGCLQEMSRGSLLHLRQLCGRTMAEDTPFLEIDQVLRLCLLPILNGMAGCALESAIS